MKTIGTLVDALRQLPQDVEVLIGTGGILDKTYEIEEIECVLSSGTVDGDYSGAVYIVADKTERGV